MKVPKPRRLPSGTWYIQLRLGGESVSVSETTRAECVRQAQLIKSEYLAGKRPAHTTRLTLAAAIEEYCAVGSNSLSPETVRKYLSIKNNQFQTLMGRTVQSITAAQWKAAINEELETRSATTVSKTYGLLKTIVRYCEADAPRVKIGSASQQKAKQIDKTQFLEPEQIAAFVEKAAQSKYAIPLLLALSSLRMEEIDGLDWSNLTPAVARIRRVRIKDKDNRWIYKDGAKTESSVRDVDILIPALRMAVERQTDREGKVMSCSQQTLRRECERVCEAANVPVITPHKLRHSFASLTAHLGIPEIVSQQLGGWSNDRVMKEIYTHVATADLMQSKNRILAFYEQHSVSISSANL